jgi:hypothetical protein
MYGNRGVVKLTRLRTHSFVLKMFHWAAFGGLTYMGNLGIGGVVDGDTLAMLGHFSLCYSLRYYVTGISTTWGG